MVSYCALSRIFSGLLFARFWTARKRIGNRVLCVEKDLGPVCAMIVWMELDQYMAAEEFVDSSDADVQEFAQKATAGADEVLSRAVKLYYAVRDEILYDPY